MPECGVYEHAKVTAPYLAPYQVVNSSLALLAMDVIDPKQEISQDLRIRAIKETKWQGRMETVLPGVIVDGAHNADGIAQFVKTVQSVQERYRIVLLFSAVVEKNYEEMIHTICSQTTPSAVVVIGDQRRPHRAGRGAFRSVCKIHRRTDRNGTGYRESV